MSPVFIIISNGRNTFSVSILLYNYSRNYFYVHCRPTSLSILSFGIRWNYLNTIINGSFNLANIINQGGLQATTGGINSDDTRRSMKPSPPPSFPPDVNI
jgi:hypothetical protein